MLAALGMGLVQGFTKNIQEEKAIRASEQQSVDKLNDMLINASLTGGKNFSQANAAVIANAIKTQQGKLDERERIDIFGTPGPRISTDLSSIVPLLKTVDEESYSLGGFKLDNEIKFDYEGSYQLLNDWTRIMADPKNVETLATKTPGQLSEINAAVTTARRVISTKEVDTKTPGAVKIPNLYGEGQNAMFPAIANWDNFAKGYFPNTPGVTGASGWKSPDLDTILPQLQTGGTNVTSIGEGKIQADGSVSYQYLDFSNMPLLQQAHDELATSLGLQGNDRLALLDYWQTQFMNVPGDPQTLPTYTANALQGALEFGLKMANPDQIKVSSIRQSIAGDGAFATLMYNSLTESTLSNGGDHRSKVYALAAHLPAPVQQQPTTMVGDTVQIAPQTVQTFILQKVFGPDKQDIKFKEFMDGQSDLKVAVDDLNRLKTEFLKFVETADRDADGKLTAEAANMAYENFKKELKVVFDIDQGMFGGLIRDVKSIVSMPGQSDADMLANNNNLTQEYLDKLNAGIMEQSDVRMARLEAMRISLAFRMARAADPSGRLSNQDIEIQLRKLGTNFSTIEQATGALNEAIREFTIKQEQYAVFEQFAADDYVATPNDLKVVEATLMIDELERGVNAMGRQGSTSAASGAATPPDISNVIKIGGKYIDQATGNTITDQAIIDAYEAAQGSI
jgi:hypothetical protein